MRIKQIGQRWLARRIPRSRQLRLDQRRVFIFPSAYGFLYLAAAALMFFGGINYDNNLILGLCFLMVSLFLVAILHTFRNLYGLTLRAGDVCNGFVGGQGRVEVVLSAERRAHRSVWLSWLAQPAQQVSLEPGEESNLWLNLPLSRRGPLEPPRLRVASRYPLGLLRGWSLVALEGACLAWPQPQHSTVCPAGGGAGRQDAAAGKPGGNQEFQGLRRYRPGDSPRLIDWKGYARGHGLNIKEFEQPADGRLWLRYQDLPGLSVEQRLSILCFWVRQLSDQHQPFGLALPGAQLAPASGEAHRRAALDRLAWFGMEPP